ncbi:type VI secretion system lipoprotein TssJ, partial [Escherichia coli]|nr:type VI secretion system lipoprotein TssJ [Escherichia coli]
AAMFLEPDRKKNTWRVVLSRDELEPDTPRLIEVSGNTLTLLPVKDK